MESKEERDKDITPQTSRDSRVVRGHEFCAQGARADVTRQESIEADLEEALKVLFRALFEEETGTRESEVTGSSRKGLSDDELAKIRWLVTLNPNTPPVVLDRLVCQAPPTVLERIAEHPRTRPTTLSRLAFDPNPVVRAAVIDNINVPVETAWMLARDEHVDVRFRAAESYHLPLEIVRLLCEDDNPYVAHRACQTYKRMTEQRSPVKEFSRRTRKSTSEAFA